MASDITNPKSDDANAGRSVIAWLTHVPRGVEKDIERYYVYWRVFYILGGTSHFMVLLMFWTLGVHFMALFNILSVAIFAIAFFLLSRGYYKSAYWLAITELIAHGICATFSVGVQYGFMDYTYLVVVLFFIQPFFSWRLAFVLTAVTLVSAAVIYHLADAAPPLYAILDKWSGPLALTAVTMWPFFVLVMVLPFMSASERAEAALADAYRESERLLLNILPESIAKRLKTTGGMIADDHERVAILFADLVGFTKLSGRLPPTDIVVLLNEVFHAIDRLTEKYGVEKIKTIGDAYMVVAGVPTATENPEEKLALLALELQDAVSTITVPGTNEPVQMRVGINAGRVVAGVIGERKFAYDLWGDAVNVAARMETAGEPGKIHVTKEFADTLTDRFEFEDRGEIEVKGKGRVATSFLVRRK